MCKDGVLRYLHGDGALHPLREHLGNVGLVTDADGTVANRQGYHAYACPELAEGASSVTAMICSPITVSPRPKGPRSRMARG